MSRRCQITGKIRLIGNTVSHANNKAKRTFNPNIQTARIYSEALKRFVRLTVTPSGLRTIEINGGLDAYVLSIAPTKLDAKLRKHREQVSKAAQAAA